MMKILALMTVVLLSGATGPVAAQDAASLAELPADWDARDLEGRWFHHRRLMRDHPASRTAWLELLARSEEFELLETIALHEDWREAANHLLAARAPQWIRVHVWFLDAADSHGFDNARTRLQATDPALVLAWLQRHAERLLPTGVAFQVKLDRDHDPAGDPDPFLPPLDPDEVLRELTPPRVVIEAPEDLLCAEQGVVYVHQVERAIKGLLAVRLRSDSWANRLLELVDHAHPAVRRAAILAWPAFGADPAVRRLLEIATDESEARGLREQALLAATFAAHPAAWLETHRVALCPDDPGHPAALSRLGDLGDAFTTMLLEEVVAGDDALAGAATDIIAKIAERGEPGNDVARRAALVRLVERAAWTLLTDHPLATRYSPWAAAELARRARQEQPRAVLAELAATYEASPSPFGPSRTGALTKEVRALARRVLSEGR